MATLCQPLRADLAKVQRDPWWDGMRRERYNAKLAEGRAVELADAPLGVKIVVLYHLLAAQRFIHRNYKEVFKKAEVPPAPGPARPGPKSVTVPSCWSSSPRWPSAAPTSKRPTRPCTPFSSTWPARPATGAQPRKKPHENCRIRARPYQTGRAL